MEWPVDSQHYRCVVSASLGASVYLGRSSRQPCTCVIMCSCTHITDRCFKYPFYPDASLTCARTRTCVSEIIGHSSPGVQLWHCLVKKVSHRILSLRGWSCSAPCEQLESRGPWGVTSYKQSTREHSCSVRLTFTGPGWVQLQKCRWNISSTNPDLFAGSDPALQKKKKNNICQILSPK